jgi:hypothetical protein
MRAGVGKHQLRFKLRPESDKPSEDRYRLCLEASLPALRGIIP